MGKKFLVLLIFIFFLSGCSTTRLALKPNVNLKKYKKIYIIPSKHDPIGIKEKLTNRFIENNFNVVTKRGLKDILIEEGLTSYADDLESYVTLKKISARVGIDAMVEYDYIAYWDVIHWSFRIFNLKLIDTKTGDVIASGTFSGDDPRSVDGILDGFFNKIKKKINSMPEPKPQHKKKKEPTGELL